MHLTGESQSLAECIRFEECRAKTCTDGSPGTFVFDHCRYAGYVAEALLPLLSESVRKLLPAETPFLVSLHDVGKVSPGFEGKYFMPLLEAKAPVFAQGVKNSGYVTNHASIGAKAILKLFGLTVDHPLVRVIAAHHGFEPDRLDFTRDGVWQNERKKLIDALAKEFRAEHQSVTTGIDDASLLVGITCVSDWIASDEDFFPPNEKPLSSEDGLFRAKQAVAQCGFVNHAFRHGLSFRDIFGFDPYPAQRTFLDNVTAPGVYVLEAPMGMGKTESALFAAYKLIENGNHSGIYFALPTRLTSDRIHERVESFLRKVAESPTAVKLAHGQAWLKEFESGSEGTDEGTLCRPPPWFNPSKRGLLFPFAVGTIDQALMAVLNVKYSFVRSFGLAGKVVILDEVHSYDAYTGTLLDELVARLRNLNCTVIILSATLTAARRRALLGEDVSEENSYPLFSSVRADGQQVCIPLKPPPSRYVRIRWIDAAAESPISEAIAKARTGCNVLCIANTVSTAQEWFRMLKSKMTPGEFPIGLLHAKFVGGDREKIEGEWMERLGKTSAQRPHGSILVSTQIVEQSVDIDADWMLSELAPADMLLQRIGRLWRHERASRPVPEPELAIVCAHIPQAGLAGLSLETKDMEGFFGRGVWVYAPYVLLRTFEVFRSRNKLSIPGDIRPLLETIYAEDVPDTPLHKELYANMTELAERLRRLAVMGTSDVLPVRPDDEERAGTRYSSRPSVSLLLLRTLDRSVNGRDFDAVLLDGSRVTISRFRRDVAVTKVLYRNLVQVAPNDVLSPEASNDSDIFCCHFFKSEMPHICIWDAETGALRLWGSESDTGYAYYPSFGACRMSPNAAVESESAGTSGDICDPEGDFIFDNDNDW